MATSRLPKFTERFTLLRGERTQAQFADFLGISRPTVALYESGTRIPDIAVLKEIAQKCQVSADYLLGLTDIPASDTDIRFVAEYTGLETDALEVFHRYSHLRSHDSKILELFDLFIKRYYARFLHRLLMLSSSTEEATKVLNDPEADTRRIDLWLEQVKINLYSFSELCNRIPNDLFDTDKIFEELEKRSSRIEKTDSDYLEEFLESGDY